MSGRITPPQLVTPFFYVGIDTALQTIVAPASNTKGVRILGAFAWGFSTGLVSRVMAKASAPVSALDTAALTLAMNGSVGGTGSLFNEVVLPPGIGIYAQKEDANGSSGFALNYEVLA